MPDAGFPLNIVDVLAERLGTVEGLDSRVLKRPLRLSDPAICIGVHAFDWAPVGMPQIGQFDPSVTAYVVRVQNMVRHSNEEEGRALFTGFAKIIRNMLYRDATVRTQLAALTENVLGSRESVQKFGVRQQRFLNNEFKGAMAYLASTDFFVETEIRKL